jgi:hypothetical protein
MLKVSYAEKRRSAKREIMYRRVGLACVKIKIRFMKAFGNPVKRLVKGMLVCGFASAMAVTPLFAQVYTGTLANLANGGTLTIDDKIFSGFKYLDTGLTSFDPTQINVTASESGGIDYLTWSGNISFTSTSTAIADLLLNYIVTANLGTINMIDQSYTLGSVNNGLLSVAETVATGAFGGTVVAHSNLDLSTTSQTQGPNLNINPAQSVLYVTKDISLAVISPPAGGAGSVTITQVEQSFHQVPEPGTMLLGSLGGGLLLFLKSRRQARHN